MTQSQQIIEELYDSYTKTAANIIVYYEGNEMDEKLKELKCIVNNNSVQDKKLKLFRERKNQLLNLNNDDGNNDNHMEQSDTENRLNEYRLILSKTDNDTLKDDKLIEFDKHVEALLDGVAQKENDTDAEIQLKGGYVNVIDPISKKRIVDPVKNTICGHTYDQESIMQLLKINKKTRCPVIGCKSTEFVQLSQLRPDIVTKTYLEKHPE
ncbi:E3 SUMO-protein ligase NSE2-like [Bombus huntii]|uniref:E3 SUMO-protein ligase NSE2-like n=1 Tax=Bombus huntii TaxID=85661 RepID=UPI0021AAB606|nr:E3 SUMO-protein ligase NSE2-like [Bombus huntii]XP_050472204.1 E3 SUMO-protein ligase NSE2-like [Bombus huntii]XP_050472205.1 E3 SUMO-protein ligase NSE2-like [Bombus huntii]XP_050472206.1 E3 SUMO-protein ligase NSE2-like [Bombus huntii]